MQIFQCTFYGSNTHDGSIQCGNYELSEATGKVIPLMREKFPAAASVAGNA